MLRLELMDGKSCKFWEIELSGASYVVRWGRIGAEGQAKQKGFSDAEQAREEHDKLVAQKTKKGYVVVTGASAGKATKPKKPVVERGAKPADGTIAVVSGPEPPVDPGQLPPIDVVVWTEGARRQCAAVRGEAKPAGKPTATWEKIRARFKKHQRLITAGQKEGSFGSRVADLKKLMGKKGVPELDVPTQAALYALLGPKMGYRSKVAYNDIVNHWIREGGLPFALEAWAAAARLQRKADERWSPTKVWLARGPAKDSWTWRDDADNSWRVFRRHIAALDDATFEEVRVLIAKLRDGAPIEVACRLTAAFGEDSAWAREDAKAFIAKYGKHSNGSLLPPVVSCLSDADHAIEVIRAGGGGVLEWIDFDLVARLGVRAQDVLLPHLEEHFRDAEQVSKADAEKTKALALIHSKPVGKLFASLLEMDGTRAAAAEYFTTAPRVAIEVLSEAEGKQAKRQLELAVASSRNWVPQLRGVLSDAAWERVSTVLGASQPTDFAEGADVPDALRELSSGKKTKPLPKFYVPSAFSRPVLTNGKALDDAAMEVLGALLMSRNGDGSVDLSPVKSACTAESLAAYAWDVFTAWQTAGYPSKDTWALRSLGLLGGDDAARRLTPLIRAWPGESAHHRAVHGLDVLAEIGSDVALMHLHGIAQKLKFKALQDRAGEKVEQIAKQRGLTAEELADRLVPDLGLDERGTVVLDFGPRQFAVGFDESLRPFVKDANGAKLKDLPKPGKTDDAQTAEASTARWKALKKDARAVASGQVLRLELAMCLQREWTQEAFRTFFIGHPLLVHLVRRLVWAVYDSAGKLVRTFRVAEDGSLADENDEGISALGEGSVRIGHALELGALCASWAGVFADYEILQPFEQLGRATYESTSQEKASRSLDRVKGKTVPTGKVLGLERRGWRRGPPEDAGVVHTIGKALSDGSEAQLDLDPGIFIGYLEGSPEQKLGGVWVGGSRWSRQKASKIGALSAVDFSELVRDLESLLA